MDMQNRVGSKTGGGGMASWSETNADRRERLRKLALETIDLSTDPYFMKNHLGSYECKLCLTVHSNEGSYLAHTQGKKHQTNLARRAAREAKETHGVGAFSVGNNSIASGATVSTVKKTVVKIGRPGYKVTKVKSSNQQQQMGLLFQIMYPEINPKIQPRYRFMSAFEQKVDLPPDKAFQYVLFAAEPYETIAFKIPSTETDRRIIVDSSEGVNPTTSNATFLSHWDPDSKQFYLQFMFKQQHHQSSSLSSFGVGGRIPMPSMQDPSTIPPSLE